MRLPHSSTQPAGSADPVHHGVDVARLSGALGCRRSEPRSPRRRERRSGLSRQKHTARAASAAAHHRHSASRPRSRPRCSPRHSSASASTARRWLSSASEAWPLSISSIRAKTAGSPAAPPPPCVRSLPLYRADHSRCGAAAGRHGPAGLIRWL
jgi:hypothetical protein